MIIERQKRSIIWTIDEDKFKKLVEESKSYTDILHSIGIAAKGGNSATLKRRIKELNCSTLHFDSYYKNAEIATKLLKAKELVFCENSSYSRKNLKKRIIKEKLIEYICSKCKNKGEWNHGKVVLQLEHKNGISNDNRLENLEFLCPNCHSQTESYAGKNNITIFHKIKKDRHAPRFEQRKVNRPSKEELELMVWDIPTTLIAEQYGVSDVMVSKWCKSYGIIKPTRGYWTKNNSLK